MTEAEWLATNQVTEIFRSGLHRSSMRKTRLLVCSYCRHVWRIGRLDCAIPVDATHPESHGKKISTPLRGGPIAVPVDGEDWVWTYADQRTG